TALCGIVYYAADQFPKEFHGGLFLGDVVLTRVNAYKLEYSGSTPKAVMRDFWTSGDPWFRPVDIKLGPDGALYVADFYNNIIGHCEVPLTHPERARTSGRIWRVVWKGDAAKAPPPKMPVPDFGKASVEELVKLLGHPNLTVRLMAANQLAGRRAESAAVVK